MIYVDNFFSNFLSGNGIEYNEHKLIPVGCKIIGIAFFDSHVDQHQLIIDELLTKTETLLVYFSEPTQPKLIEYIEKNTNTNIHFFTDAIVNLDNSKTKTAISWFIFPKNFYAVESWAPSLLSQLTHSMIKPKKFECLLGRSRAHRNIVEQLYFKSAYQDQIIFSYFKKNILDGVWDYEVNQIQETHERIVYSNTSIPASAVIPVTIYNQSYYSIVAETISDNRYSQFTEKVAKPIVGHRLFVCFSGQYYLRNLKSLGFKTFDNVIDETYDNISDQNTRFELAWKQVEYLCDQNPESIILKIQDTLEHNYQHFLSTDWHSEIRKIMKS
jgi:hypothetical protein